MARSRTIRSAVRTENISRRNSELNVHPSGTAVSNGAVLHVDVDSDEFFKLMQREKGYDLTPVVV